MPGSISRNLMIAYLRNPYGIDELELRKGRLQAADELERLYSIENDLNKLDLGLNKFIKSLEVKNGG